MATTQQQLAFAIRAVNESSAVLKQIQTDLDGLDQTAAAVSVGGVVSATGQIDNLNTSANNASTGGLARIRGALGSMATVAGGFVIGQQLSQLPSFLLGAAQGAAADEQATMRLDQALRNAGGAFDENRKKLLARIAAGQKLAFTDDDVRDSFQTLLAATGDVDQALSRQTAAMDLARGANIPLSQASKLLGRINEENVQVFRRMGIVLADGATEADALAAVQGKFGEQSKAYAQSTAGQFEVASIRMAELKESLGAALLPAMTAVANVMSVVFPAAAAILKPVFGGIRTAVRAVVDNLEFLMPVFAGVGAAALVVAGAIVVSLIPAIMAWIAAEVAKTAALIASTAAFIAANAPLILLAIGIGLLVAGIILLIKNWDAVVAKFPVLGTIADNVKAALEGFATWITGTLVPAAAKVFDAIRDPIARAIQWVTDNWGDIYAVIKPGVEAWKAIIEAVVNQIETVVRTWVGVIKGIIDVFIGVFTGDWDRAWQGVKQIFESVWYGLEGTVRNAIGLIKDLVPIMLDAAQALGGALLDGLKAGIGAVGGIAGDLAAAVTGALKGFINTQVIDRINSALEFKIAIPGAPDITINPPDIPRLAAGGVVMRPTLALIGESGPEAVIPLNGPGSRALAASGPTYIFGGDVYVNGQPAPAEVKRLAGEAFLEMLEQQFGPGRVQWGAA